MGSIDTDTDQRIVSLDVVRGIAVMGILTMNIAAFALPYPAYPNPAAWGGTGPADLVSWAVNFVVFDSKMRSLFSILFGASTLLVIERATAAGGSGARAHFARMAVLLAIGLAHFYLLWWGDILALYAMCGMLVYWLRGVGVRKLVGWGLTMFLLSNAFFALVGWSAMMAGSPSLPPHAASELYEARNTLEQEVGATSKKIPADLELYQSDYRTIAADRIEERTFQPFTALVGLGFETVGLMMIGMALFRVGFLTGEWSSERYRKWAVLAAVGALPPLALMAWWQWSSGFDSAIVFTAFAGLSQPFDLLLALGWAAAIILWLKSGGAPALKARVAAAGRMAFTNYLATSAVMTTIFYGYGLGLFGEVGRAALWLFVIGMWALMLAWSKPWLERYRYGPLEWLWRSLARGRVEPMRRGQNVTPPSRLR
ncbi:DUF418 domain-containing protein [Sphingomonas mesophila]|uniref:DUF418 domain-containing protein n=1 Tax=Sphingomonas mesophila TaxID=2303576 RepID=UPI001F082DCA|nr:DUF418 domain-containing protein [Sphingomonas mesophila]